MSIAVFFATVSLGLAGETKWSKGKGYVALPASGCPAQPLFGYKHLKQLNVMSGCSSPAGERRSWGVFRGGAPTADGVACLGTGFHVSAVFDLRSEGETGTTERKAAEERGLLYYNFPMATDSNVPSESCKSAGLSATQCNRKAVTSAIDEMERLLSIDPAANIYVHCARGEDRTGLVIGLFRVLKEGCLKADARQEMREYGYTAYSQLKAVWDELTASAP